MKVKRVVSILGAVALAYGGSSAIAADSFTGFYVSGGVGQKSANVEESVTGPGGTGSVKLGDTSFAGQLAGGYSLALTPDVRIALGAFYDLGNGKAGTVNGTIGGVTANYEVKETRHYGISIEPGYAFTKDSVAYVKLMYNWIKGEENLTGATTGSGSSTFRAFGYGMGLKHLINNNVYLFAEWQYTQYNTNSFAVGTATASYKPRENLGLFGVGSTF